MHRADIHTKNRDLLAEILYKYKPTPHFYSGHTHTVTIEVGIIVDAFEAYMDANGKGVIA